MAKRSFSRLSDIWRSNVNELLDRMEDPERMVRQLVRDMEAAVDGAVGDLAKSVAEQRRQDKQHDELSAAAAKWEQRAEQALEGGDEQAARDALARKADVATRIDDLRPALEETAQAVADLRSQLMGMRRQLEQARGRQGQLAARCRAMRASARTHAAGDVADDPFVRFEQIEREVAQHRENLERYEQQVDAASAEADVYREMAAADTAQRKISEIEREQAIDDELAALRAKVAQKD